MQGQSEKFEKRFDFDIAKGKTVEGSAYLKGLRTDKVKTLDDVLAVVASKEKKAHKQIKQTVSYETARLVFHRIVTEKLAAQGKMFYVAGNDAVVIRNLILYFIGDNNSSFDLRKGICLMGNVGPGKTFLMESFQRFCQVLNLKDKQFKMVSTNDIYDRIAASGNKTVTMSRYFKGDYCFDDLGDEPLKYMDYGNEILYMIRVMTKRYEAYSRGKIFTYATMNLDVPQLRERYGERFYDRFKDMFNIVLMDSPSKR